MAIGIAIGSADRAAGTTTDLSGDAGPGLRFLLAVACSMVADAPAMKAAEAAPPNVLFICTDDLRPPLQCYGAEWMHTPNIDALAFPSSRVGERFTESGVGVHISLC